MSDYTSLRIKTLIVHEVPTGNRAADDVEPVLSETASPMTPEVRNFFEERLRATLGEAAFPASPSEDRESRVPDLAEGLLDSRDDLVTSSQQMASRLFEVQSGVNSPGLLAVAVGALRGLPTVAVIKLEKEHGVRVRPDQIRGLRTLNVEHVRDLMLTGKTRVFKTGLFTANAGGMQVVVCDYQGHPARSVAGFFLRDFLGCELVQRADLQTRAFMRAVEDWINSDVESPEDRSAYSVALISELNSQQRTITPSSFASTHLKTKHRQSFVESLKSSEAPTKRFHKDTVLVEGQLRRIRYDVDTGATVIAPPDAIGDTVKVVDLDDGRSQIQVDGRLNRIQGKRR